MTITLNSQACEVEEQATLHDLMLRFTPAQQQGTAVAVNNQVIPRAAYGDCRLQAGDEVLMIKATQGG